MPPEIGDALLEPEGWAHHDAFPLAVKQPGVADCLVPQSQGYWLCT